MQVGLGDTADRGAVNSKFPREFGSRNKLFVKMDLLLKELRDFNLHTN